MYVVRYYATGTDREHRILYVQTDPMTLVLLHAFVKTTQRTPRRHIETALKRASYILGS